MSELNEYGVNWSELDLSSAYERNLDVLDSYNLETLLLEIRCNIKTSDLSRKSIMGQAEESIRSKVSSAIEVLFDNLDAVLDYELSDRED
tara:strand:+ start:280 stop:549 length:270 start_codon:yes stop_codon:yes gene_type:complete